MKKDREWGGWFSTSPTGWTEWFLYYEDAIEHAHDNAVRAFNEVP